MLLAASSTDCRVAGMNALYAMLRLALAAVLLLAANLGHAATVGQVEFAQGLVSAQQRGQTPRFLSKGDTLQDGDVINTGGKGFAVIVFPDGAKMTLRPNTTFAIDQYNTTAGQESVVMRLLKGGLRAITGAIGKSKPESVRISTPTSTIGIRGTSFDARICEADCAKEIRANAKPKPAPDPVVARVAAIIGSATAINAAKQTRSVAKGAALYTGESIRTEKGAYVVLVFRDETRVTVASESEFKLENVRFAGDKADSGNFAVRLLRGTARAFTGLLAKRDPKAVQFSAGTSTIGIRGTGFDMRLVSECAAPGQCADSVYAQLWDGSIDMNAANQSVLIPLGRAAVFNGLQNRLSLLDRVPDFFTNETAPRPDQIPVDESFFSAVAIEGAPAGVYVNVRDGHIEFLGSRRGIDLGRSEAGYLANGSDTPVRLTRVPSFMSDDPIPAPEDFDEKMLRLLETLGDSSGGLICEI
jgi:hypothetical protein